MRFLPFLACLLIAFPAIAADPGIPLEIEADKALVWDEANKQYRAEGNAVARQGDMQVTADLLTADYHSTSGQTDIWQIVATGNVKLSASGSTGTGDKLVYDITKGQAVLTGQNLMMTGKDGSKVTANERFEYWSADRRAVAVGDAKLIQGQTTLASQTITAWLAAENTATPKTTQALGNIERAEASGAVTITTPTETITAQRGEYRGNTNTAYLYGTVVLKRPPNTLEGARAEINLTTNVSQLFAGTDAQGKPGRVKGVFYTKTRAAK
ncbi:MAG: LptA/OstA family protein [Pseudomonadota bacterium]